MLQYFSKRFLMLIPKMLLITVIVFYGMELMPGDVVLRTLDPSEVAEMSMEQIEALREAKGLNDPSYIRYFRWLAGLFQGDMGYSLSSGTAVTKLLGSRLPATIVLSISALIISTILGLALGFLSSIKKDSIFDRAGSVVGLIGISIPQFFFCLLFILLFSIHLKWLPTGGRVDVGDTSLGSYLRHLILPSFALGMGMVASLMRYTRSCMLDVMGKDYIKTARSKGLREAVVFTRHCFRNGCSPVVLMLIGRLGMLIGGTTIVESVFSYSGMGNLFLTSLTAKDTPVVMTILMLTSMTTLVTHFIADIALAMLDPRVRFGKE